MDNLKDRWQHLTLTEVEGDEVNVDEQKLGEEAKRGELSIVGKVMVERTINREVIRSIMAKAWKTSKSFTVVDIKPNLFVISQGSTQSWYLTRFYGNPDTSKRQDSWKLLAKIREYMEASWCVLENFNKILSQDEKCGGQLRSKK